MEKKTTKKKVTQHLGRLENLKASFSNGFISAEREFATFWCLHVKLADEAELLLQ